MNDDLVNQRLRETVWRRKLTDAEQAELRAWLATHPDARDDWRSDVALNELLARLPDVAVPSNFTARVLQAVGREAASGESEPSPRGAWAWRVFAPRFALAVILVASGWFAYQWHARVERTKLAQSVAAVADVRSLPNPQFLEDFDAISRLPPMPPADDDLLALMK